MYSLSYTLALTLAIAYLLGTLPGALIVCRLFKLPDPRQHGSENPGSTNVARLGGKKAGFLIFVIDCSKGFLAILIAKSFIAAPWALGLNAFAVGMGHCYPLWFKGKGGKGVATFFGAVLGISPFNALITAFTWSIVAKTTSYVSLASLLATAAATVISIWIGGGSAGLACFTLIVWVRHHSNIKRLLSKSESKLGAR